MAEAVAEAAAGVVAAAAATVVAALAAVAVVVVARAAIVGVVGVVADVAVRVGVGVAAVAQKAAMVERERGRKQRAVDLQSVQRQLEAEAALSLLQNNQQCRRNVILKQGKRCGTVTSRQEWLAHEGLSVYWCVRSGAGRKKKENRRRRRLARNAQLKCAVYERVQRIPGLLEIKIMGSVN